MSHLEWFHDHVRIERLLLDGCGEPTGGRLAPTEAPGHGLSWRAEVAEQFRVARV